MQADLRRYNAEGIQSDAATYTVRNCTFKGLYYGINAYNVSTPTDFNFTGRMFIQNNTFGINVLAKYFPSFKTVDELEDLI